MATIVPRWEWRTFGTRFPAAEAAFGAFAPSRIQESEELYLLSEPVYNVKVRDDLLDIKVLREVNKDGLERWEPVMKVGSPLAAADVKEVRRCRDEADAECEIRRLRISKWRIVYLVMDDQPIILGIRQRPPYDYSDIESLAEEVNE